MNASYDTEIENRNGVIRKTARVPMPGGTNGVASAADAAPGSAWLTAAHAVSGMPTTMIATWKKSAATTPHMPLITFETKMTRADGEHGVGELDAESREDAAGGHQLGGEDAEQARDVRQRRPQPHAAALAVAVGEEVDRHDAPERAHALGREQAGQDEAQAAAEAVPHARPDARRSADLGAAQHHARADLHGRERRGGERQPEIAAGDQVVRDALDAAAQHRTGDQRAQEVHDDDGNNHRRRIRGVHAQANGNLARTWLPSAGCRQPE